MCSNTCFDLCCGKLNTNCLDSGLWLCHADCMPESALSRLCPPTGGDDTTCFLGVALSRSCFNKFVNTVKQWPAHQGLFLTGFHLWNIRWNWNDTEKISMAPAQRWHAQIKKCTKFLFCGYPTPKSMSAIVMYAFLEYYCMADGLFCASSVWGILML